MLRRRNGHTHLHDLLHPPPPTSSLRLPAPAPTSAPSLGSCSSQGQPEASLQPRGLLTHRLVINQDPGGQSLDNVLLLLHHRFSNLRVLAQPDQSQAVGELLRLLHHRSSNLRVVPQPGQSQAVGKLLLLLHQPSFDQLLAHLAGQVYAQVKGSKLSCFTPVHFAISICFGFLQVEVGSLYLDGAIWEGLHMSWSIGQSQLAKPQGYGGVIDVIDKVG